jgi:tetratricopeptide (TPR) repeat protein
LLTLATAGSAALATETRSDPTTAADAGLAREAKELTRAGIAHYRAGRLDEARAAFAKAWSLKPSSELAASLAEVEMKLDHYADAAEHWTYYIQNLPPDRTEAEYQLAECRRHLGSVRVAVDTPGALVSLDGKVLGPAPLRVDLWVSPGSHVFDAKIAERAPATQHISIGPGEAQLVSLELGRVAPPERPVTAPTPDESGKTPPSHAGGSAAKTVVIVSGTTLALAGVGLGVGFTLKANNAGEEANAIRDELHQSGATASSCAQASTAPLSDLCPRYGAKLDEQKTAKNIAIGTFAAGGAMAVGTLLAVLLWPADSPRQHAESLRVNVTRVSRDGAFVTVGGSF